MKTNCAQKPVYKAEQKNSQTDRFTALFSKFWKLLFISDTTFSKLWSEKFK